MSLLQSLRPSNLWRLARRKRMALPNNPSLSHHSERLHRRYHRRPSVSTEASSELGKRGPIDMTEQAGRRAQSASLIKCSVMTIACSHPHHQRCESLLPVRLSHQVVSWWKWIWHFHCSIALSWKGSPHAWQLELAHARSWHSSSEN